jgi:hypothetical protein
MTVTISFDASLSERTSGAAFVITARDQQHARQIATWLRGKVCDTTRTFIWASVSLPPQHVNIELPDEPQGESK